MRGAVLEAAERLFAERGVERVSLRDVAAEANVQMALIWRYVGKRDDLIEQVFLRLCERLAEELTDRPLQSLGFERDTVMGRWTVLVAYYVLSGQPAPAVHPTPVEILASVFAKAYGLDEVASRVRAAQVTASGLGWRLFEPYVIDAADLGGLPLEEIRADLTALHRRSGATPWPTPESSGGPEESSVEG